MSPACPHVALAEPNYVDVAIGRLREARRAVARHIRPTPLVPGDGLISRGGNPILLKAENLQPSGSFKIRGALHVISGLSADQCKRGVIAYSTGNHAQAVAIAARKFGTTATIVMSPDAPPAKIARTRKLGAEVIMAEPTSLARRLLAEALSHERELTLVPPYDHPGVIVGQGTLALELLDQGSARPAAVFLPIGGGGLIAGVAACLKQLDPGIKVIGVEPEWENDAKQSFQSGRRVTLETPSASIADAIKIQTLGSLTFPLIQRYVDEVVTVTEDEIVNALRIAFSTTRMALEPAGAVALAAALTYGGSVHPDGPVITVASGGNVDLRHLCSLMASAAD